MLRRERVGVRAAVVWCISEAEVVWCTAPLVARRPWLRRGGLIERQFHVRAQHSDVRTEIIGGTTTFVTLSYIIFVQPAVLATTGMDPGAVMTATCLASAFATLLMGLWANYPIAVAPAMGHNFYFAFMVAGPVAAGGMGYSWPVALGANCVAGASSWRCHWSACASV